MPALWRNCCCANNGWPPDSSSFPVCFILAVAGLFEILEWLYAVSADPAAGAAVRGSQGDVWDAQKDRLADGLGSLAAMILFFTIERNRIR